MFQIEGYQPSASMDEYNNLTLPPLSKIFRDPFINSEAGGSIEHKCEISFRDARINTKGERVYLHAGTKRIFDVSSDNNVKSSALLKTRYYDREGYLDYTETTVQSNYIRTALQKVMGVTNPQVNFKADKLVIREFEQCLFHYYKDLQEYGKDLTDEMAIRHVDFALQSLYKDLGQEMQLFRNMVESVGSEPRLDFATLWMAFCPGDLVLRTVHNVDCVYRVVRTWYLQSHSSEKRMNLSLRSLDFDGEYFQFVDEWYHIHEDECPGYTRLDSLPVIPLKYLKSSQKDKILEKASITGKTFLKLSSEVSHHEYHGLATILPASASDHYHQELIRGRVIIDCRRCSTERPEAIPVFETLEPRYSVGEISDISYENIILARTQVTGFSLKSKTWCRFDIEKLHKICYNQDVFGQLMLPPVQKDMIRALVLTHQEESLIFDDVVKDKGKGITILLHGPPGVGKTLTAESVAELAGRPLYSITAGDLGGHVSDTERKLVGVLDLCTHWNAILLIDEADVFLEERSTASMERNAIVSVFLRTLEYYQGVLILTTNRVSTIDPAFQSRIHLGIKYRSLSNVNRRMIWEMFIRKTIPVGNGEEYEWMSGTFLDDISNHNFNGRMIKNAVRMALALAVAEKVQLGPSHLQHAVKAMNMFQRDMDEEKDEKGTLDETSEMLESTSPRKRRRFL